MVGDCRDDGIVPPLFEWRASEVAVSFGFVLLALSRAHAADHCAADFTEWLGVSRSAEVPFNLSFGDGSAGGGLRIPRPLYVDRRDFEWPKIPHAATAWGAYFLTQ